MGHPILIILMAVNL